MGTILYLKLTDLRDAQSLTFATISRTADARDHLDCRARLDQQSDDELRVVARTLHFGATNQGLSRRDCGALLEHLRRAVEYDTLEDPHCSAADRDMADNQADLRALNATAESWRQRELSGGGKGA